MSQITERIQAYADDRTPEHLADLADWLARHTYVDQKRYNDPQPAPGEEREWDHPYIDGSWDEVQAQRGGMLTKPEYAQIVEALHAATH